MRFRELNLIAFGHFSNAVLQLQERPGTVHFFLGRNEAGKSTTLRAIRALLYGFPERSRDNFLHPKPLVGARLELESGEQLELIRRKGRKNTILDRDQNPMDEVLLLQALQGVGEAQFVHGYGLNHESLRTGAQALLEGRGHLGQSLFGAQIGSSGIHRTLHRLDEEASELFRPRGKQYPLNQAIHEFKEAQKRMRNGAVRKEAYREQRTALDETRSQLEHVTSELRRASKSLEDKTRQLAMLPLVSRFRAAEEKQLALGTLPTLPEDAADRRLEVERALERCNEQEQDQRDAIERLQHKLSGLDAPSPLLKVSDEVVEEIELRKAGVMHAEAELPAQRRDRETLQAEVEEQLALLGRGKDAPWADLQVPTSTVARIHSLSRDLAGINERLGQAKQREGELKRELGRVNRELAACAGHERPDELIIAIEQADVLLADDKAAGARLTERERLNDSATRQLAGLHPLVPKADFTTVSELQQLNALPLPDVSIVDRFERDLATRTTELERAEAALADNHARLKEIGDKRSRLERDGEIPSVDRLNLLREQRDKMWGAIRRSLQGPDEQEATNQRTLNLDTPDWRAFEGAVSEADAMADKLRHDAGRVALAAELNRSQEEAECAGRLLLDAQTEAAERLSETRAEWEHLWAPLGLTPLTPGEMRSWLRNVEALQATVAELAAVQSQITTRGHQETELCDRLISLLDSVDINRSETTSASNLAVLREVAEERRKRWDSESRRREALVAEHASLEKQLPSIDAALAEESSQHNEAVEAWAAAIQPLGLSREARPEEATATLERTSALLRSGQQLRHVDAQIKKMEDECSALAQLLEPLTNEPLRDGHRALAETAGELVRRHRRARQIATTRGELEAELGERQDHHRQAVSVRKRHEITLDAMMVAAGVTSIEQLRHVHTASATFQSLEQDLATIRAQLEELADGQTVSALLEEFVVADAGALRVERDELQREIRELEESREELQQTLGRLEAGLENQRSRTEAATAAADAEAALAAIKEKADRYVQLRLSAVVLRREVERYRAANEAPLMARANALFPQLTLGAYQGLRVGFGDNDEAVLRCVRADGREVGVEQLSDGTQDQLYLALRLSSLERQAAVAAPFPLLLDDVLIHFDDQRARATLQVLADFAQTCQVLFFSHQARLLELAREAIPPEKLDTIELDEFRGSATVAPVQVGPAEL